MRSAWAIDSAEPTQSTTALGPAAELAVVVAHGAGAAPDGPLELAGCHHEVGAELGGQGPLVRVLGGGDQLHRRARLPQRRDGEQAEGAAADRARPGRRRPGRPRAPRRRSAPRARRPRRSARRAPRRAGSRGRPSGSTSRRRCSRRTRTAGPGSRSPKPMRSQWLMRPSAHGGHTGLMPRATQLRTGTTTARCAVVEVAHHLVAGGERERHDRLEPARRRAVDGGEVGPADARQPRAAPAPSRARAARAGRRRAARGVRPWRPRRARAVPPPWRRRTWPACARTRAPSPATSRARRCRPCRRGGGAGPAPLGPIGRSGCGRALAPCRSARRASRACGPGRPAGSRG